MRGIKAHFVALISTVILCLVVATAATPARSTTKVTVADCTPAKYAFVAKCFRITTSPASSVAVNTGTDRKYTVPTTDRLRSKHTVWVRGLSPNTPYFVQIVAKNKAEKVGGKTPWSKFTTAAPGSAPATVTTKGNKLLLNGLPFFPIEGMTFLKCLDTPDLNNSKMTIADDLVSLGSNVITGSSNYCSSESTPVDQLLHQTLKQRAWWHETKPADAVALKSMPELLNWNMNTPVLGDPASLIGCRSKGSAGQYDLVRKKTGVTISAVPLGAPVGKSNICITPATATASVYTSIAAGTKGIEWVTINPLDASSTDFSVGSDVAAAASKISKQFATLSPAILNGKPVEMQTTDTKSPVKFGAWQYSGTTYVVAVNTSSTKAASATFRPLRPVGSAKLLWESRRVKVVHSSIVDTFTPLAVHLYMVK